MDLNQENDHLRHPFLSSEWGQILHKVQVPEWKSKSVVLNFTLGDQICVNKITLLSLDVSKTANEAPLTEEKDPHNTLYFPLYILNIFKIFVNILKHQTLLSSPVLKVSRSQGKCKTLEHDEPVFKQQIMGKRVLIFLFCAKIGILFYVKGGMCIQLITRICKLCHSVEL